MNRFIMIVALVLSSRTLAVEPVADATAKFLAGLPVRGTPAEAFSLDPAWTDHAAEFDRAWGRLEQSQLAKIRDWAPRYLGPPYTARGPMFYFFSGPDFLYAQTLFPNADTYILCGIEPVGAVPDLAAIPHPAMRSALTNLRKSLESSLSWSFFITKNMKVDLTQSQFTGTLPVLLVFLARGGCTIEAVEPVALDRTGAFCPGGKGATPGVRIAFTSPSRQHQMLYYFASDLANDGIRSNPGFLHFCEQQDRGTSLLKAASYLLHNEGFSKARDFLLTHSSVIVQDDSGMPLRFFPPDQWKLRYCGRYSGPIDLFKQHYQPDLAKAFASTVPAPLDFGFGYQWRPTRSGVVIAMPR